MTKTKTKNLKAKFNKIINTLKTKRNSLDQYNINKLFNKAINLTKYNNVDCDTLTPMLDYNIKNGYSYIDDLENDIGNMSEKDVDNDSPKAVQKENMLAFVENNFIYHNLQWYITNDDETKVRFIDINTAIQAINDMKNNAMVF